MIEQLISTGIASVLISFLLGIPGCENHDTSRPEWNYDSQRVADELRRLEQMSQIEEVLGHDTQRLNDRLEKSKKISPAKAKSLLAACRDEYLKGLKDRSGVPLGGIGAGTVELWPDGGLHDWRIAGNWDLAEEAEFSCFAIRTDSLLRPKTRVLQNAPWAGRMRAESIKYDGRFPFVLLDYGAGGQPVSVKSSVFSSFIPHDAENSCLPVACFTFEIMNNSDKDVHVSFLFAAGTSPFLENGVARWDRSGEISTISNESDGNAIALSAISGNASFASGWSGAFLPSEFQAHGSLRGRGDQENGRIAICSEIDIDARKSEELVFLLSWYFPDQRQRPTRGYEMEVKFEKLGTTQQAEANKYIGRRYNKFGSLKNINTYFVQNRVRLEKQTLLWVNSIYESSMDTYLKSLLCNSLYPLFKTSFWTEDGLFNILESTNCCANPDCVHVRYYGSIPVALLFPELDKQVLGRLAKYRGPFGGEETGQIPEQFYGFSLELPFGRPLLQNNLCFVLMVYRDYIWTGDTDFLRELWPAVREAMALAAKAETDGDGLPDNVGIKQSYDDYDMGDSPTYTSGIWLASLRAAEEIALAMNDTDEAETYREIFEAGRNTMESTLWNGEYYALTDGDGARVCFADALNGQWYADMLGLGDLLDKERIKATLAAIFKYNHAATPYGVVNGFVPGHGIHYPKQAGYFQTQSASVWTGTTFAVASLGLYRDFCDDPLEAVKQVHDNYATHLGNLWNIRESNDAESGLPMAWPFYYRPMSMWSVLLGLEGFRYDAIRAQLTIKPPKKLSYLKAPIFIPGVVGEIEFSRKMNLTHLSFSVHQGNLSLKEIRLPLLALKEARCSIEYNNISEDPEKEETILTFARTQRITSGSRIDIELIGASD